MSDNRHAATISERIAAREGTGTHRERLHAADMILWEELHKVQKSSPREVLFVDLGLETSDYTYLTGILSTALHGITARREQATRVLASYPLITLGTLVGTALLSRGASYWDSYAARLRFPAGEDAGALLRPVIPDLLRTVHLNGFEDADLRGQQFIGTITLHAGLPNQDLPGLLEYLRSVHLSGTAAGDSENLGRQMQRELVNGATAPVSLISLARVLPDRAAEIFSRVHELQRYSAEQGGWPTDKEAFEGTHGLPEPTFSHLVALFAGDDLPADDTPTAGTMSPPVPYLQLNQEDMQFELVFPEHHWAGRTCRWTVQSSGEPASVAQAPNVSYGGFEERRVPLTTRFTTIKVTGPDGHTHTLGVGDDRPLLLLRPNGHLRHDQESFRGTEVLAAVHDGVTVTVPDHRLGAIAGWSSWSLRRLDVRDARSVDVRKGSFSRRYKANRESSPVWEDGEGVLKNLVGTDKRPVFTSSPLITLPMDSATWTFTWTRTDEDGTESSFDMSGVEFTRGEPAELFPSIDGDPWVGRYTVALSKDGRVRDRRTFNMAEGLSMKVSFSSMHGAGEFQFLQPQADGPTLSPAYIEFGAGAHSHLTYPVKVQRHRSAGTYVIRSTSDPGARLTVIAQVPQLRYLLPLVGEMSQWVGAHQQIDADALSETDPFRLRFPVPVHDVSLTVVPVDERKKSAAGRPTTIELESARNGREWSCPTLRITSSMATDADYRIVVSWQPKTIRQFVEDTGDSSLRREFYRKGRNFTDPRPAPMMSPLFQVTKNPLLTGAVLNGTRLKLTLGRHVSDDLTVRAWQVTKPLAEAVDIPMSGTVGTLPEAMVEGGPLIIEARENNMDMLFNGWAGDRPSPKAVVVDQVEYHAPEAPLNPQRWMFDTAADRELLGNELQEVWTARDRFHAVLDAAERHVNKRLGAFDIATRAYLLRDPRASLTELNESGIPAERQLEAFVRSRLALASFSTADTAGVIHPEPWIGVIQEMNDVRSLYLADRIVGYDDDPELDESRDYLRTTGGSELWHQFTGTGRGCAVTRDAALTLPSLQLLRNNGTERFLELVMQGDGHDAPTPALISLGARSATQAELVRRRNAVNTVWDLSGMYRVAEKLAGIVLDTFRDPELRQTVAGLSELPASEIRSADDEWLRAPLVSFVFSFVARGIAHGIVRPTPEFLALVPSWALLARHLPELTAFDLVTAEASALAATTAMYREASHG